MNYMNSINNIIIEYIKCPDCLTSLEPHGHNVACSNCKKEYDCSGGVLDMVGDHQDNVEYIKDIDFKDLEEFEEMNSAIRDYGIDKGRQVIKDKFPGFYNYLFEEGRADWRFYLDLDASSKILDLGCGWGNLSFELAREYGHVTAVDYSLGKLSFMQSRRTAQGVNNVDLMRTDINRRLPFCDNHFDLVVLNGVLEWVGEYKYEKPPEVYQKELLIEINRVLKPDGYLYVAIENRYGYPYFLGAADDHSRLRFTNIMPRALANWYMKMRTGKEYRTYTYSYNGLRKLLNRTGFDRYHVLMTGENYKYYRDIVPLYDSHMIRYYYKSINKTPLLNIIYELLLSVYKRNFGLFSKNIQRMVSFVLSGFPGIFKYFVPAFGAVSRKIP